MKQNLLIIGAGIYGLVAREIAESMGCFDCIAFVDDGAKETPDGIPVIGTTKDLEVLSGEYKNAVVAIGNPAVRLRLLQKIENETLMRVATLVSPQAYISRTAQIGSGSIVEPMAVIHTGCVIGKGCIISAGAVVNHASLCGDGVHVDCNATVAGNTAVPGGIKVTSGTVYQNQKPSGPIPFAGQAYSFEDGM